MVLPAGSPPQSAMFYIALPCLPRYIKSRTFLQLYGDNAKVKKKLRYLPSCPRAGGAMVTNG